MLLSCPGLHADVWGGGDGLSADAHGDRALGLACPDELLECDASCVLDMARAGEGGEHDGEVNVEGIALTVEH